MANSSAQLPTGEQQKFQLIHDRDAKFSSEFREAMKERDVTLVKLPVRSPNLNARCERVIQTIRHECLNPWGEFTQQHVVREILDEQADIAVRNLLPECHDLETVA